MSRAARCGYVQIHWNSAYKSESKRTVTTSKVKTKIFASLFSSRRVSVGGMCVWVSDSTFDMTAYTIRFQNRKPIRRKFYSRGQGHHYQRDAQRPHNHTFDIFMCCTCDGWCSPLTQSNCAAHRASRNVDHRFHTRPRVNTTILYNRTLYVLYMRCRYDRRTYRMSNAQTTSTSIENEKWNCRCTSELRFQFSFQ